MKNENFKNDRQDGGQNDDLKHKLPITEPFMNRFWFNFKLNA